MAAPKAEVLPTPFSVIGEGPHWDADTQSLYYNDIYGSEASILRYDFNENKTYLAKIGELMLLLCRRMLKLMNILIVTEDGEPVVSFIIPVEGTTDQFAVGIGRRVGVIQWNGKSTQANLLRIVFEVEKDPSFKFNRFNDAKADPKGRFFGGTMRLEECGDLFASTSGSLYRYAKDEQVAKLKTNISVSNGLAWNEKTNKFYYIDTCQLNIKEFDYDPNTGDLCEYNTMSSSTDLNIALITTLFAS